MVDKTATDAETGTEVAKNGGPDVSTGGGKLDEAREKDDGGGEKRKTAGQESTPGHADAAQKTATELPSYAAMAARSHRSSGGAAPDSDGSSAAAPDGTADKLDSDADATAGKATVSQVPARKVEATDAALRRAEQEREEEASLAANLAEINKRREQAKRDADARKKARERLERLEEDVSTQENEKLGLRNTSAGDNRLASSGDDGEAGKSAQAAPQKRGSNDDGPLKASAAPSVESTTTAIPHYRIGKHSGGKQTYSIAELRKVKAYYPYGSLESCSHLSSLGVPMQYEIVPQHLRQGPGRHGPSRNFNGPRPGGPAKPKGGLRNPNVKGGAVVGQGGAARNARLGIRGGDPRNGGNGGSSRFASGPFGGGRMGMGSNAYQQQQQSQPRSGGGGGGGGGRMGMGSARGKAGNAGTQEKSSDWRSGPRRQVVSGTGDPFCMNPTTLHKAEKAWKPSDSKDTSSLDVWKRKIGAILNKLSRENFNKLADDMLNMPMESLEMLKETMNIIFDKALAESFFSDMYADLCRELSMHSATWNFTQVKSIDDPDTGVPKFFWAARVNPTEKDLIGPYASSEEARAKAKKETSFKRILLNKCQEEFEKEDLYIRAEEEYKVLLRSAEYSSLGNDEKVRRKLQYNSKRKEIKKRMLGNVQFIGELFKQGMLTERIMHECILKMLGGRDGNGAAMRNPDGEEVEALCKLVTTIGQKLDHERAKNYMDTYFCRLRLLSKHPKLEPRAKFMCSDLIDLRKNSWVPRRKATVKARTKAEVRAEAEDEERRKEQGSRSSRYGGGGGNFDRRRGRSDRGGGRDRRGGGRVMPSVQSRREQYARGASQDIRNNAGGGGHAQLRIKKNDESFEKARASGELAASRGKVHIGKPRAMSGRGGGPHREQKAKLNAGKRGGSWDDARVRKMVKMDLGDLIDGNTQYGDLVKNLKSTLKEASGSALSVEQALAHEAIQLAVTKCFGVGKAPKVDLLCDVLVRLFNDRHISSEALELAVKAVTQKIEEIAEDAPLSKDIFSRILAVLILDGACVSLKVLSDSLASLVQDEYSSPVASQVGGSMLATMLTRASQGGKNSNGDVDGCKTVLKLLADQKLSPTDIDAWIVPRDGKVNRERFIADFKLEPLREFFGCAQSFASQLCAKLREGRSVDDLIEMLSTQHARKIVVDCNAKLSKDVTACVVDCVTAKAGTRACKDGNEVGDMKQEKYLMKDYARLLMNITHACPDTKEDAQMQCLLGVQEFCSEQKCPQCALRMFKALYDTNVVQEDTVIAWYDGRGSSSPGFVDARAETEEFVVFLKKTPSSED